MCLWRQGDGIVLWWTWEVSLHGPALDPVSEINSWKLALQKPDAGPQRRCADLTRLQRCERITLSLFFFNGQEKVFHPCTSRTLTHFKHRPTSAQSQSDGGHMSKVAGQEKWHPPRRSSTESLSGLLSEGSSSFCLRQQGCLYGLTGLCGWMIAALPAQMTPCLRVNRAVTGPVSPNDRAARPLFCQQQLKVGILNPNTSLSTYNRTQHTAGLNQTLCRTARSRHYKHKYN